MEALKHGPLPESYAEAAAIAAKRARKPAVPRPLSAADHAFPGELEAAPRAPVIVGGFNEPGQSGALSTPPDTTGAIGPLSFVQLVNRRAAIFERTNGTRRASGTLNALANAPASVSSFDPQVIWDATTNRFYYAFVSIYSATDHRLSFGFSKTSDPANVTTDWCRYTYAYGDQFPDYPKLGDSRYFIIIGANIYQGKGGVRIGSDVVAISKPAAGTTCPAASTFKSGKKSSLVDSAGKLVFTPVPANQIDLAATGYVVARNGSPLPANKLWFFNITRNAATGLPIFGAARALTVPGYTFPFQADQPTVTQTLDTLDARLTQAVQATDPRLGKFAFWTQHTIADPSGFVSAVRWYEIDPVPAAPVVLRWQTISTPSSFRFNASISPNRRVDGATRAFGASFVIHYSFSSNSIPPSIVAASSFNGGPLSFANVQSGVGPYKDSSCSAANAVCRWGDYSGATPDPRPAIPAGVVWGTNQFSGVMNPRTTHNDWRTQIFALRP
jgi:hypothetical protein